MQIILIALINLVRTIKRIEAFEVEQLSLEKSSPAP